jgi:hypothetical protein
MNAISNTYVMLRNTTSDITRIVQNIKTKKKSNHQGFAMVPVTMLI